MMASASRSSSWRRELATAALLRAKLPLLFSAALRRPREVLMPRTGLLAPLLREVPLPLRDTVLQGCAGLTAGLLPIHNELPIFAYGWERTDPKRRRSYFAI